MKRINLIIGLTISIVLFSCSAKKDSTLDNVIATNNIDSIKVMRANLVEQEHDINEQITELDKAMDRLDTNKKISLVSSFIAKNQLFNHYLEVQANIDTKQNIVLYPEYSGLLEKVLVKEGQKVSKGQLLAVIDDGGLSQQVTQAEIQANLAKTTYERQKRLWDKNIGSEMQFLQAKSTYESQEKMVAQLKSQLAKTTITAPFSGIIDNIITEAGNVVGPGQKGIIRLINLDNMYAEAEVPETYINNVVIGKSVSLEIPVLSDTIVSTVNKVGNYISPDNRSFRIEVKLENKNRLIKPNMTAKLQVNDYTNKSAILIPQNIISENSDGEKYIYLAQMSSTDEGTAKQVFIQTGKAQGEYVEVTKGLKAGDAIIKEGARSILNGQKIKILN